jgi:hypothetical protein
MTMKGITGFRLRPLARALAPVPQHDWRICALAECDVCDALVRDGTVIACDGCGNPGHTDAPGGWVRAEDGQIFCEPCAAELEVVAT